MINITYLATLLAQVDIAQTYGTKWGVTRSLGLLVALFLNTSIIVAGIVFLFLIIFAGYKIISAAGNPDALAEGQKLLTFALIGLIIVAFAYWGIRFFEIITGSNFLTEPIQDLTGPGPV